ncbi:hypothetical protein OG895_37235 [Streptomyces sp. NBC_00201]|uniref:hypothetical protein n=1 Tax=Streptomyces sp. NBC_00201 TaxID=2975679 RepID=UPI002255A611|nr:hypothetical protein [Streptomyces sp. NBC_00201]MCX5250777.1 hypothetical protein [Streptomyces sp. NBC_00201]
MAAHVAVIAVAPVAVASEAPVAAVLKATGLVSDGRTAAVARLRRADGQPVPATP